MTAGKYFATLICVICFGIFIVLFAAVIDGRARLAALDKRDNAVTSQTLQTLYIPDIQVTSQTVRSVWYCRYCGEAN